MQAILDTVAVIRVTQCNCGHLSHSATSSDNGHGDCLATKPHLLTKAGLCNLTRLQAVMAQANQRRANWG